MFDPSMFEIIIGIFVAVAVYYLYTTE